MSEADQLLSNDRVTVTINGEDFEFLVDPTSEISIINWDTLRRVPGYLRSCHPSRRPTPRLGRSWTVAAVLLPVTIGRREVIHEFSVSAAETDSILGRDFITELRRRKSHPKCMRCAQDSHTAKKPF